METIVQQTDFVLLQACANVINIGPDQHVKNLFVLVISLDMALVSNPENVFVLSGGEVHSAILHRVKTTALTTDFVALPTTVNANLVTQTMIAQSADALTIALIMESVQPRSIATAMMDGPVHLVILLFVFSTAVEMVLAKFLDLASATLVGLVCTAKFLNLL
jgi:hypothetical protein